MFLIACFSLVLRSSFDTTQTAIFLSGSTKASNNLIMQQVVGETIYSYLRHEDNLSPSLLVYSHDEIQARFVHYNYTVIRCFWNTVFDTSSKVTVMRDMIEWLDSYNTTLNAHLIEADDFLAWNIATYENIE
jgi:hypothetical protein